MVISLNSLWLSIGVFQLHRSCEDGAFLSFLVGLLVGTFIDKYLSMDLSLLELFKAPESELKIWKKIFNYKQYKRKKDLLENHLQLFKKFFK